jgi:hypothetical protein
MSKRIKTVVVIGALSLMTVGAVAYYTSDSIFDCDVERYSSVPSPDGKKVAVIFEMGCGATVSTNTQVNVAPSDASFEFR